MIFSGGGRAQLKVWCVEVKFKDERKEQKSKGNKHVTCTCDPCKHLELSSEIADQQCQEDKIENIGQSCIKSTQMCCNRTLVSGDNVMDNRENNCKLTYLCLADFQLSSITRKCKKPWRQPVDNSDPETRILDLSVVTPEHMAPLGSRSLYLISAACSDGFLRFVYMKYHLFYCLFQNDSLYNIHN